MREAQPVQAELVRRARGAAGGARLLPLEQVDRRARDAAFVVEQVRVPLHAPGQAESAPVLRHGLGVRERREADEVAVERERAREIGAVRVDVDGREQRQRHRVA